jgi:hypothetical protein
MYENYRGLRIFRTPLQFEFIALTRDLQGFSAQVLETMMTSGNTFMALKILTKPTTAATILCGCNVLIHGPESIRSSLF